MIVKERTKECTYIDLGGSDVLCKVNFSSVRGEGRDNREHGCIILLRSPLEEGSGN